MSKLSSIGIIGAGHIGVAFARALARRNIPAILANSRGPESLQALVQSIGPSIRAGTREQAAAQSIVLVAVNWSKLPAALSGLANFAGRIVIDSNNPIEAPLFNPIDLYGRTSSEVFADLVPGAHVVKAFNHLPPRLLIADPAERGGRRVLFLAGDDNCAKNQVSALINELGFAAIDLGKLLEGGRLTQFPGGPLPSLELVQFG
jgi:predicted dinucleotide-binding enzyme